MYGDAILEAQTAHDTAVLMSDRVQRAQNPTVRAVGKDCTGNRINGANAPTNGAFGYPAIFRQMYKHSACFIFRQAFECPRLLYLSEDVRTHHTVLSSGRAEAALSAHGIRKLLRLLEFRGDIRDDDELCYPLSGLDGLIALSVVEQRDLDLTAVVAVDHADLVCRGKRTL